jgi:creatinine amidohydrolase
MTALRLREMTWTEVAALDISTVVAILPIGAVEAHGPHLPLITDGLISDAMACAAASRLEEANLVAVILPALDYSAALFAEQFPGTISIESETVRRLIFDVASSLTRWGVPILSIANAHLDPAHLSSLHAAVNAVRARGRIKVAFPDLTQRPWGSRLTEEFKSGSCHAGQFETSIVLAAQPNMVREDIQRALPANNQSLSKAISAGHSTFAEAGGPEAYFGTPGAATLREGRETIEILGEILAESVLRELGIEAARSKELEPA